MRSSGTSASSEKSIRASTSASASIDLPPPRLGPVADHPLELAKRLPALRLRFGGDEIRQALDRRQIEPAVLESAAGEFAGSAGRQPSMLAERLEHARQ